MDTIIKPRRHFTPEDVVAFMLEQGYSQAPGNKKAYSFQPSSNRYAFPFCFGEPQYVSKRNPRRLWLTKHEVRLPQVFAGWLSFTMTPEHGLWKLVQNQFNDHEIREKFAALRIALTARFCIDFELPEKRSTLGTMTIG